MLCIPQIWMCGLIHVSINQDSLLVLSYLQLFCYMMNWILYFQDLHRRKVLYLVIYESIIEKIREWANLRMLNHQQEWLPGLFTNTAQSCSFSQKCSNLLKIEIALILQSPIIFLYLNILYFHKWRHTSRLFLFSLLIFRNSQVHTENKRHSQAFITRSPRISGFQSSHDVSKPSAKRMQKFLKCPLLTRDSEEQAVMRVLSMVSTKAEPVSRSPLWLDCKIC